DIVLEPAAGVGGVMRVTVYVNDGDDWRPAAERLVFRQPAEQLKLTANFDKPQSKDYKQGDKVNLRIQSQNEKRVATPDWLYALVIDDKVLKSGEAEEPSMPAFFYLNADVRQPESLEDANVLLSDALGAAKTFDLVLGTQGWRRFVLDEIEGPRKLETRKDEGKAFEMALMTAESAEVLGRYANAVKGQEAEQAR